MGNDLSHDITGHLEGLGAFNHLTVDDSSLVQHVLHVDQAAVEDGLDHIVQVVDVDGATVVGFHQVCRQNFSLGNILGDFSGNEVSLGRGNDGVFVGIFIHDIVIGRI